MPGQSYWGTTKPPAGIQLDRGHSLAQGLVGFWPLGADLLTDASGVNPMDTCTGVTSVPGRFGGPAAQFVAASSQRLTHVDSPSVSTGGVNFTLSGWVRLDSKPAAAAAIIAKFASTSNQREFILWYNGATRFDFRCYPNGTTTVANVTADALGDPSINTWYFIVAWCIAGVSLNIQVNNGGITTNAAGANASSFDSTALLSIGAYNSSAFDGHMDGRMEGIGFWKRVLSSQERAQLYAQPYAMFAPPIWRRYYVLAPSLPPGLGPGFGLPQPFHYDRQHLPGLLVQPSIQGSPLALVVQPTAGQSSIPSRTFPRPLRSPEGIAALASLALSSAGVSTAPVTSRVTESPVRPIRRVVTGFLALPIPDNPTPTGQSVIPSRSLLGLRRPAPHGWALQTVAGLAAQPSLPDARGSAPLAPLARQVPRQFGVLGLQRLLLGADQFYGAAGQAPTWSPDLPPRVAPRVRIDAVVQALQVSLFVPPPAVLPDGRGSTEPAPPARRPERQHAALVLNLNLLGQDTFYGGPGQAPGISLEPPLVRLRARPDTGILVNAVLAAVLPVPLLPILSDPTVRVRPQPTPSITLTLAATLLSPPDRPSFTPAVTSRQTDPWLGRSPLLTYSLGFSAQQILDQTRAPFAPAITERRGDPWLGRQVLLGYALLVQPPAPQQQFYAPGQVAPWGNFPLPPRPYPRGVSLLQLDFEAVRLFLIELVEITFDTAGPAAALIVYEAFADALGIRYEAQSSGLLGSVGYESDSDPLR